MEGARHDRSPHGVPDKGHAERRLREDHRQGSEQLGLHHRAAIAPPLPLGERTIPCDNPRVITFIRDTGTLNRAAADLAREECLWVDLEADSLHHYREKVCLLQISVPHHDYLVDTLAVRDPAALRPHFADPAVRKVFHAGDYDLRCLWRDFHIEVRGLFDTMIAAQLLGEEKIGLSDLLAKHVGVALDKRFQKADWSTRPLPPEMVRYAVEDTRHLGRLADPLEKGLSEMGRRAWAAEEFTLLEQVRPSEPEGPIFLRVKGSHLLNRRGLAILDELVRWRETAAEHRDVPPFRILENGTLMELVRLSPLNRGDLRKAGRVHRRAVERHEREILAAVARGLALPEDRLPAYPTRERPERDNAVEKRLSLLKAWRTKAAGRLGISPGILINNALLEEIAGRPPRVVGELQSFPTMKAWQRRELGGGILDALNRPPILYRHKDTPR